MLRAADYVAAVADRIFVDKASIVGSIGVLMDGFGSAGLMERLGIERRLLTAGENKGFLDPFSPQQPKQLEHAEADAPGDPCAVRSRRCARVAAGG